MGGLSRALLLRSAVSSSSASRLQHRTLSVVARRAGAAAADEGQEKQRQRQRQQVLVRLQQRRAFHASRRQDNPILIGLVIVVGATIARYLIRAAQRVSKEEGKDGKRGDDDDDKEEEDEPQKGTHPARGFPVLGLDVGSLQASVAVAAAKAQPAVVVENHEGRRSTPAFVAFEEGSMVVGQLARRARWREPARVGFNLPRLLGAAAYDDSLRPLFPFPVAGSEDGGGLVLGLGGRAVSAGEATGRVVEDLVQSAEHKTHRLPRLAVLAVPSYFDAGAKERALRAASEGAGLGEGQVEVVEDAIATLACAHYTGRVSEAEAFLRRPWLVCDVGGLSAQVSVVQLDPEHGLAVRGQGTSWAVGGEQLDAAIVHFLAEGFRRRHGGIDLRSDYLALERLHEAAEAAKAELSSKASATVRLPFITADHTGPKHLDATLSRAQLEGLAAPLLEHLKEPFAAALRQAGLSGAGELQGVIVSGGTARLPFVPAFVAGLARPAEPPLVVLEAPEEAAALGAAYFGRELVEEGDDDA